MSIGFGAFGKIPALGDFLRHKLPTDFVQTWDPWLQKSMTEAQASIGPGWDDAYLSAAIWRFTLPKGVAGASAISGILMASVDAVGRRYPLTLAAPHTQIDEALPHFSQDPTFEKLENAALATLEDDGTRDILLAELSDISWTRTDKMAISGSSYTGALPAAQVLAAESVTQVHKQSCIWTAVMEGDHRMLITRGLPAAKETIGLFDLTAPIWSDQQKAR